MTFTSIRSNNIASAETLVPPWIVRLVGRPSSCMSTVALVEFTLQRDADSKRLIRESKGIFSGFGADTYTISDTRIAAVWHPKTLHDNSRSRVAETLAHLRAWLSPTPLKTAVGTAPVRLSAPADQLATLFEKWLLRTEPPAAATNTTEGLHAGPIQLDAIEINASHTAETDRLRGLVDQLCDGVLLKAIRSENLTFDPIARAVKSCFDLDGWRIDARRVAAFLGATSKSIKACLTVEIANADHLSERGAGFIANVAEMLGDNANVRFILRGREGNQTPHRITCHNRETIRFVSEVQNRNDEDTELWALAVLTSLPKLAPYVSAISVFDGPFSSKAAAHLLSMTQRQADDVLAVMEANALIRRHEAGTDDLPVFTFQDVAIREAAESQVAKTARKRLHRQIAAALRSEPKCLAHAEQAAALRRIAYHLGEAGALHESAEFWLETGTAEMRCSALDRAADAFENVQRSVSTLAPNSTKHLRASAALGLAKCQIASGAIASTKRETALRQLISTCADAPALARIELDARWLLVVQHRLQGRLKSADDLMGVNPGFVRSPDAKAASEQEIVIEAARVMAAWHQGATHDMRDRAHWATAAAEAWINTPGQRYTRAGLVPRVLASIHGHMGLLETLSGNFESAHQHRDRALAIAQRSQNPTIETDTLIVAAQSAFWSDDHPATTAYAIAAKAIAQRYNLSGRFAYAEILTLSGHPSMDSWAAARAMADIIEGPNLRDAAAVLAVCQVLRAQALFGAGRFSEAHAAALMAERLSTGGRLQTYWPLIAGIRIAMAAKGRKTPREALMRQLKRALKFSRKAGLTRVVETLEDIRENLGH